MKNHVSHPLPFTIRKNLFVALSFTTAFIAGGDRVEAASISVPNYSFESQRAGPPFYADPRIDSWKKAPRPAYFDENAFGITWDQTAGNFLDNFVGNPAPLDNRDGDQGAYFLAFPGVSLFQDYNTVDWHGGAPTHAFDATFEVGKSYQLTIGLLGKGGMADGTAFLLGLYYGDSSSPLTVASTTALYSAATFPSSTHLVDFVVNVPTVQATDAWAGQHIGIELINLNGAGAGYWDMDNVRLISQVPEPSALSLLALGMGAVLLRIRRSAARTLSI
jgi:hypothetical protein